MRSTSAQSLPNLNNLSVVTGWDATNTTFNAATIDGAGQTWKNFNNSGIDLTISYSGSGTLSVGSTYIGDRLVGNGLSASTGNTYKFKFSEPVILSFTNDHGNGLTAGGNAEQTILTADAGSWTYTTPWPSAVGSLGTASLSTTTLTDDTLTFNAGSGSNPGSWFASNTVAADEFTWNHTTSGNTNGAALERIGFEIVPEPSSSLLLGLGALGFLTRRKR